MIPNNFDEAITCEKSNKWKAALNFEMDSLVKNNMWAPVTRPPKIKSDCEY